MSKHRLHVYPKYDGQRAGEVHRRIFGKRGKGGLSKHADPTPDEIAAMCAKLRKARTDEPPTAKWEPPVYSIPHELGMTL